ncbi:hypothetical protein [Crossiella sp. CA198]|uniref:hypothetical protein n=1 Tax=Crossiella sp. CA198 TaxID=3455607 RepID=UPI003F8D63EF
MTGGYLVVYEDQPRKTLDGLPAATRARITGRIESWARSAELLDCDDYSSHRIDEPPVFSARVRVRHTSRAVITVTLLALA